MTRASDIVSGGKVMSDPEKLTMQYESLVDERPPAFNDVRDDYDDKFEKLRPGRHLVKRQLLVPALAHICIGAAGGTISLLLLMLYAVLYGYGDCDLEEFVVGASVVIIGMGVFALLIAGGDAMLRLRRRPLAVIAALVVAALSIPLFLFGIWALLLLNRPEVRREFERRPVQSQHDY